MKSVGIIPARYASTRFPGKPLALIGDKTMIQRVYEQAVQSKLDKVYVATDDQRILEHVTSFGGKAILTSPGHPSGTDRCCEALYKIDEGYEVVLNIQGDEPFINPSLLNQLVDCFADKETSIATPAKIIEHQKDIFSPNVVKVVKDNNSTALYFSRSAIPNIRNAAGDNWIEHHSFYSHVGIYAFRSSVLKKLVQLPQHPLEIAESLEQLRWLANGYKIRIIETNYSNISVDTPEDLAKAAGLL